MSDTRLSFVIPARNEEALIAEVLDAILASIARTSGVQKVELWLPDSGFEVVVADDGSEDATAHIVARFLEGLADGAEMTLHVRLLEGRDTQHVLDSIFKALGVALAQACRARSRKE